LQSPPAAPARRRVRAPGIGLVGEADPLERARHLVAAKPGRQFRKPKADIVGDAEPGSSRGSWKMMPILACGADIAMSSSVTVPDVARSSPAMARSRVDLPQPEPPMMATISPSLISAEKRSSALTPFG